MSTAELIVASLDASRTYYDVQNAIPEVRGFAEEMNWKYQQLRCVKDFATADREARIYGVELILRERKICAI